MLAGRQWGGVWWQRDFRLLWIGETTSSVGDSVTTVALPLVAVTVLHASTFALGLLAAAAWLPWLLVGLVSGAWVDRVHRRGLLVACDVVSAVLLTSVPVAAWLGVLTVGQLLGVALLGGVSSLLFSTAYHAYLPALIPAGNLVEANVKLTGSRAAAQVGGPGIAGVLAQMVGAVLGLLADALTFLISAVCLLRIRSREPAPGRDGAAAGLMAEIRAGLRLVATDRFLRSLTVFSATGNLALTGWQTLEVVFLVRVVGVNAATVGGVLAVIGVGGVCGALLAGTISRRFGTARGMLASALCSAPFGLFIPLTGPGLGLVLFAVGGAIVTAGLVITNVIARSFRQSYCPAPLLGRITATMQTVSRGAKPLGALLAGSLGTLLGPRDALWFTTSVFIIAALVLLTGPIRRRRDLPITPQRTPMPR